MTDQVLGVPLPLVALLALDDDQIATSDPDELERLVIAAGRHVDVITV